MHTTIIEPALVETETVIREYGMRGNRAIVDHPGHGRIYIEDGYCGHGTLDGGMVRWRGGFAARVRPDDTLASLDAWADNHGDPISVRDAIVYWASADRTMLEVSGDSLTKIAHRVGLRGA